MGVDASNALREKLGLKPLREGASLKEKEIQSRQKEAQDERQRAEREVEVEAPRVDGGPDVAVRADLEVPAPQNPHFAPRPRAKGVKHPRVPTIVQIERHALEQHVNYEAW